MDMLDDRRINQIIENLCEIAFAKPEFGNDIQPLMTIDMKCTITLVDGTKISIVDVEEDTALQLAKLKAIEVLISKIRKDFINTNNGTD